MKLIGIHLFKNDSNLFWNMPEQILKIATFISTRKIKICYEVLY